MSSSTHAGTRKLVGFLLLLTYLIYPLGCKTFFSIFNCVTIDDVRYLRSDLSIHCDSPAHKSAEAFSGFMIAMFPVGLPVLYYGMLRFKRGELYADEAGGSMSFLHFFYKEYDPAYYYWEAVECLRKCMLMGFASFLQPGTLMQLIASMIFTVLYTILLSHCKPCEC
jgi:hypothetical protein